MSKMIIQITNMINNEFWKAILVGHSSYDSAKIIKAFNQAGAQYFLKKPPFFK